MRPPWAQVSSPKALGSERTTPPPLGHYPAPALHLRRYNNMQCKPLQPWATSATRRQVVGSLNPSQTQAPNLNEIAGALEVPSLC